MKLHGQAHERCDSCPWKVGCDTILNRKLALPHKDLAARRLQCFGARIERFIRVSEVGRRVAELGESLRCFRRLGSAATTIRKRDACKSKRVAAVRPPTIEAPTIPIPARPNPIVIAPSAAARPRLTGNQKTTAANTMTPSSVEEQPLKIAGSAFKRSARMSPARPYPFRSHPRLQSAGR